MKRKSWRKETAAALMWCKNSHQWVIRWRNSWINSLIKCSWLLPGSFLCRGLPLVQTRTNWIFKSGAVSGAAAVRQAAVGAGAATAAGQRAAAGQTNIWNICHVLHPEVWLKLRTDDRKSNCFLYPCFSGSTGSVGAAAADGGWSEICCSAQGLSSSCSWCLFTFRKPVWS